MGVHVSPILNPPPCKSHSEHLSAPPPLVPHAHITNHWNSAYSDKYAFSRRPKIGNFSLCLVVNLVSAGLSHGFRLIWLPPSTECHPLYPLLLLPLILPSTRIFFNESALHIRWPKYWSFIFSISPLLNIQGWFPVWLTGLISLLSKGLSRVFSNTTVWKHQFFRAQLSLWSNSHIWTWLLDKP